MQVGSVIAPGRDCCIFAAGAGKVVRRAATAAASKREASVMRHARRHGFPVPEVFDADGTDILMERVDGVNMVQDAGRRPWCLRTHALHPLNVLVTGGGRHCGRRAGQRIPSPMVTWWSGVAAVTRAG